MKTFSHSVRVYYEDTDSGGVVYYANYLKFMERSRTEWLRALGVEQDRLLGEHGVIFAVRSVAVEYHRPAHFNDLLLVETGLMKVGRATIELSHRILRQGDGEPLCSGQVRVAALKSATLRPVAIPAALYQRIRDEGAP